MHQDRVQKHTPAWIGFTYASVGVAVLFLAYGVVTMPIDTFQKFFIGMGICMLSQALITLTKTLRDNEEADRIVRRLEDAETNKLLRDTAAA